MDTKNNATDKNVEKNNRSKKTVGNIPRRQISTAALGIKVANNWATHFATLQVPNVSRAVLEQNATDLLTAIQAADKNNFAKQSNTLDLQKVNKELDAAVSYLKTVLKVIYTKDQLDNVYLSYGLLLNARNMYKLPLDNTDRAERLKVLLEKLQEANNPVLSLPNINLIHWLQLQTQHETLWIDSGNLREQKSTLSQTVRDSYESVQADIKRVHSYMAFVFSKNELLSRHRLMGFLKESM